MTNEKASGWKCYLSPKFVTGKVRERGIVHCARWLLTLPWRRTQPVRAKFNRERFNELKKRIFWVIPGFRFLLGTAPQSEKRILAICDFRTIPYTVGELLFF